MANLPHGHDVERRRQEAGDFRRYLDTAPRQANDDGLRSLLTAQVGGECPTRIASVHEERGGGDEKPLGHLTRSRASGTGPSRGAMTMQCLSRARM